MITKWKIPAALLIQTLILWPNSLILAETSVVNNSFKNTLKLAESYPVQYNNLGSIQEGINRYSAVIEKFPSHPDIYKAKLHIFDILRCEGTEKSLYRASKIIEEVVDNIDINNADRQNILLQYVDFHIEEARSYAFQNLDRAEQIIEQMRNIYDKDTYSLLRLHVIDRFNRIQILRNQEINALNGSLNLLEETLGWAKSGFWSDLYKRDQQQYTKYNDALNRISSTVCGAMERSDKYQEISQILKNKPEVLSYSEMIRDTWEKIKREHSVGGVFLDISSNSQLNLHKYNLLQKAAIGVSVGVLILSALVWFWKTR